MNTKDTYCDFCGADRALAEASWKCTGECAILHQDERPLNFNGDFAPEYNSDIAPDDLMDGFQIVEEDEL